MRGAVNRTPIRSALALLTALSALESVTATTPHVSAGLLQQQAWSGIVHEAKPTEDRKIVGVAVEAIVGRTPGGSVTTDADGRFTLPTVPAPGTILQLTKAGYEPTRVTIDDAALKSGLAIAMLPERNDVAIERSGSNDCMDLPAPPDGVPGDREYARFPVHQDGAVIVTAARLPFVSNAGYLYQLGPNGWVKSEFDYVLLRQPLPVRGGFWYVLAFGGGADLCSAWSLSATHPN